MRWKDVIEFAKLVVRDWNETEMSRMAAALAFFATVSLVPFAMLTVALSGLLFGQEAAEGRLITTLEAVLGSRTAEAIEDLLLQALSASGSGIGLAGLLILVLAASRMFRHIEYSLNQLWDPDSEHGALRLEVRRHGMSVLFAILAQGLVTALFLIGSILTTLVPLLDRLVPIPLPGLVHAADTALAFLTVWLLVVLCFRILPRRRLPWSAINRGAAFTAGLIVLGRLLLWLYLRFGHLTSFYGAAASILVLLLWIYLASLAFFLGAAFSGASVNRR